MVLKIGVVERMEVVEMFHLLWMIWVSILRVVLSSEVKIRSVWGG